MNKLSIYSTKTCGYCRMLKKFLDDEGIAYEVKQVDDSPELARELLERSGQLGVPWSVVEDQEGKQLIDILGFDIQQFNRLIQDGTLTKA